LRDGVANDSNPLNRGFVGLAIDDPVWDHSTFSQKRDRLFNEGLSGWWNARHV
jgi:hypothetical protein